MINAYVISVDSELDNKVDNHSHKSIKYKKRRDYIKNELLPKLSFCNIEIFNSITPDKFEIIGDRILYDSIFYKRGMDWNSKKYPELYLNSITLTSYFLYKKCIEIDSPILILQDDLFIPDENIINIENSIKDFIKIDKPAILYLQSECPWMQGFPIRNYPQGVLKKVSSHLSIINSEWYDIAGNVGYVINKKGAEKMISLIDSLGLSNDDQLTTIAMKNKIIEVYVSNESDKMILLNKKLQ